MKHFRGRVILSPHLPIFSHKYLPWHFFWFCGRFLHTWFSEKKAEPRNNNVMPFFLSLCLSISNVALFFLLGETTQHRRTKIWRSWASIRRRLRKRLLLAEINQRINNRRTTTTITMVSSTRCRNFTTTNTSNSRILNTLIIRCTTHNRDSCIILIIIRSGTCKEEHSFPLELESGIGCVRTVADWCFPARRTVSGVGCWSLPDRYV